MRKNIFGRQLKRDINERKALFKNLISSLILNGSIKTTEAKAKAIKADVDKIITKAKKGESSMRVLHARIADEAVKKAIFDIAPRFANRQGGYSRIIKIGRRLSDNAEMVLMELVESNKDIKSKAPASRSSSRNMRELQSEKNEELETPKTIRKKREKIKTRKEKEKED